jgi:hypothetical protein
MKNLHLNIYYKLPDDFEGDTNDAIEHMLNYRRGEKNHKVDFKYDPSKDVYDNWWEMVNTTDRVLLGQYALSELGDGEWIDLDPVTDSAKCEPIE